MTMKPFVNYHYIMGSLPELFTHWTLADTSSKALVNGIRELCSEKDRKAVDFLCEGLIAKELSAEFYRKAALSKEAFIREYFSFDLYVRNAKVQYLNSSLGREDGKDTVSTVDKDFIPNAYVPEKEFGQQERLDEILSLTDLLEREKAVDRLYWDKIEELSLFEDFSLTAILAFIAKLKIIDRWHKLDEASGRKMFRQLVNQVTATYKLEADSL